MRAYRTGSGDEFRYGHREFEVWTGDQEESQNIMIRR